MDQDITFINEKIKEESLLVDKIILEMEKVIIGQRPLLERMIIGLLTNGHILIEGVPGLAKTLAIKTLSEVLKVGSTIRSTLRILSQPLADVKVSTYRPVVAKPRN